MNWQEQQRQRYEQEQREKKARETALAEQQRAMLKAQFEEQRLRAIEQASLRNRQIEERILQEQEQQTATMQRINEGLKRANEETHAILEEVRARAKQLEKQATKVWVSQDGREFRSPREQEFWDAWQEKQEELPLVPQHPIGKYRVDFAHPESMTAIELDGRLYHTDRYSFTNDRVRQRTLEKLGWCFIRFSGDEVSGNVEGCITEVYDIIQKRYRPND